MRTETLLILWKDLDFKQKIQDMIDNHSKDNEEYKAIYSHVWMVLSNAPEDKTVERYLFFVRCAITQAKEQEYERRILGGDYV